MRLTHATLIMVALLSLSGVGEADTIFLKDGKQIQDCRVVKETDAHVVVQTKSGDMHVPRAMIHRIIRQKTIYDTFEKKRAAIRAGDVRGLYNLAVWAREKAKLRAESNRLLAEVLAQDPDHAGAHKLLGHLRHRGKWVRPAPLALRISGSSAAAEKALRVLVNARPDLRLASASETALDPVDVCDLGVSVAITQGAAPSFYGRQIGAPSFSASVELSAKSEWIGRRPLRTRVDGQVTTSSGDLTRARENALNSAFGSNAAGLHEFFDQIVKRRRALLEKRLRERESED